MLSMYHEEYLYLIADGLHVCTESIKVINALLWGAVFHLLIGELCR